MSKAIVCEAYGNIDDLKLMPITLPEVKNNEVRVAIHAAGANFPDALLVKGEYQARPDLPFVAGAEFSGIVQEVGSDVTHLSVGDRVMGLSDRYGAFATDLVCDAARVTRIPEELPFDIAAGLGLAHGTSINALKQRANIKPGETLLVLGAAGGTGLAAVQIGKALGAHVIAACSTDEKLELAKQNGADELINYSQEKLSDAVKRLTNKRGVDVVYDPVGGEAFDACSRCMAPEGRLLVVGFASGDIPKFPVNLCLVKEYSVVGVFFGAFSKRSPAEYLENINQLIQWYFDKKIDVVIDRHYTLEETPEALKAILDRQVAGKHVIRVV